jgi:hypothetical protein
VLAKLILCCFFRLITQRAHRQGKLPTHTPHSCLVLRKELHKWRVRDAQNRVLAALVCPSRSPFPAGICGKAFATDLKSGVPVMLQQEDFSGEQKSNLAFAIAQLGESDDMVVLRQLVQADIRKGREARAKGDRGRQGSGTSMSYANRYVGAVALVRRVDGGYGLS